MNTTKTKTTQRLLRKRRTRAKVFGTSTRPRLSVYRSNAQIIAQLIDDEKNATVVSILAGKQKGKTPHERSVEAGKALAAEAKKKGVEHVVFDRGGFLYAGNIKAFADAAREGGLVF
ncbi:MAG: 50S ribosomal protein L18 [bacterium]|nr:50S ribosomal protein L18 [bacterium]